MIRIIIVILYLSQPVMAQTMVMVFLHQNDDKTLVPPAQLSKLINGHKIFMQKLSNEGKLLASGSFEGGGGIFIFKSNSADEVAEWLKPDPGMQSNQWKAEILSYKSRYGNPQAVREPYEMTSYQFIRFTSYIAKFNVNDIPQLMQQHDEYLRQLKKSGNVVAEGIFNDTDGGVLIMKGDLDQKVIESDPAVRAGFLEIEIKKWNTAKGSFGEK
ncbi:MAG: hypothetical protein JST43_09225 [Bacteroidetes bacterium]|nr:hypothetical protein [Bacteroidota bacterium]MBS1539029.1 hypothetical protein [Bacteroidota bacterium]